MRHTDDWPDRTPTDKTRVPSRMVRGSINISTGVNPAGDAGDTSPQYFGWGDVNGNIPASIITYFWI